MSFELEIAKEHGGAPRCLACGHPAAIVWVHGHGQCARCGTNVQPCCQGGGCDVAGGPSPPSH